LFLQEALLLSIYGGIQKGGSMKKILSICLVLMMVATTVMAEHVISSKDNPQFLYVLSAKSGSFEGDTLTLKDVPLVIYFSDRPDRIAGHMSVKQFVELWNKGSDSFKADPPNTTLSIFNEEGNQDIVFEIISTPTIKNDSITFSVRLLLGDLPKVISSSSLFIDVFTKNSVPTFD
jgi:hypothetical protein